MGNDKVKEANGDIGKTFMQVMHADAYNFIR